MKKIVLRKCIVSNQLFPQKEMLRIVKNKDGIVSFDPTYKANGRGAYIHNDLESIQLAKKKKCLNKTFQTTVDDSLYDSLLEFAKKGESHVK